MVALDGNGKPIEVPKLKLVTEEDRQLYNAGLKRYNERVKRLKVTKRLRKKQA